MTSQPRRIPYSQREQIEEQVKQLSEKGYVEPSRSLYGANIIPVVKKDGNVRLCVDYRKLNAKTIVTPFPIPRIDDLLEKFKDAKIYSVIDLNQSGAWYACERH